MSAARRVLLLPVMAAAAIVCWALSLGACATYYHYTYFSLQDPAHVFSNSNSSSSASPKIAIFPFAEVEVISPYNQAPESKLRISPLPVAGVELGLEVLVDRGNGPGVLFLVLRNSSQGIVQFSAPELHFRQEAMTWAVRAEWDEVHESGKTSVKIPFGAPLAAMKVRGHYQVLVQLPAELNRQRPFVLELPSSNLLPNATISFAPKSARYWASPGW